MKITISPTNNFPRDEEYHNVTITIEHQSNDLNFSDFMELVKSAAVAWGYHPDTVKEYFKENE